MISDFIRDSLKNIKRNKKNVLLILVLTLLFILLFLDVVFIRNFNDYFDYMVNKNVGFRTLRVSHLEKEYSETSKEVGNISHVIEVIDSRYNSYFLRTDLNLNGLDGIIGIKYGTENITPKSIIGKDMKDVNSDEMICPYNFYPDTGATSLKIDENKILYPDELLNYEFTAFYNKRVEKNINGKTEEEMIFVEKKFKIVGFYDNSLVANYNNDCYVTPDNMILFHESVNPSYDYYDGISSLKVVIDSRENIIEVRNTLRELGYIVEGETDATVDHNSYNLVLTLTNCLFFIIVIVIFLILIIYLKKKIKNESKYLGIVRACGYNKKQVMFKQLVETCVILLISLLISLIISFVIFMIVFQKMFISYAYLGVEIKFNFISLLILSFVISIVSLIIVSFIVNKKVGTPIIDVLKEE